MSKIFRLYKEGPSTYQGWNGISNFPYNSNARDTIADPDGASADHEITSIPSPFARIDLVKTAFREVCRRANDDIKQLDGNTIFHKMVSDTLDVGEIFFNIDKFKDKIEIITWDCVPMIQKLKSNHNVSHYYVADSLEKFLVSDAGTYNFDSLKNIYILNYKNGPDELNIIGATSPATLFFCSANDLIFIKDIYFANNDKPFDTSYQPLYKRDFEYLKAWWTLRKTIPNFSKLFPEIDGYLSLTFRAINDSVTCGKLNEVNAASLNDFSVISVKSDSQGNQAEVLGFQLLKKKQGGDLKNCEFLIKSELVKPSDAPLVLPVESGNKYADLAYVNGVFGKENKASYKADREDYESRTLPFDGSQYPYLTISDFLEDEMLVVPHALNAKCYFDGHISGSKERKSYLLPLKPLFFKFFTGKDLASVMPDGKNCFEMEVVANGTIRVTLRIPIVGNSKVGYIEYQRSYYKDSRPDISATSNSGGMVELEFAGFVMPSIRFQSDKDAYYTVSYISTFSNQSRLQFYKGDTVIQNVPVDCRNTQRGVSDYKADTYTLNHTNFDYLRIVRVDGKAGLLLPIFPKHQELDVYEFAVDLGTSNTHIEMKKPQENSSSPFSIDESERLMSKFFVPSYREINGEIKREDLKDEYDMMDADYVPSVIGAGGDFSFPTRTALSCAKTTDWTNSLRVFGMLNFSMTHDKRVNPLYNSDPMVNIKWSNEPNAQDAMRLCIENLMLLMRNKVVANNGILSQTKITWFYPSSMSQRRLSQLRNAWNDAYAKMFSSTGSTMEESESVAPIQYYFRRYATATNLINIDIGGGTTDVAFSVGGNVNYITSFKFAANSLFEDSFSEINPGNGIVDCFKGDVLELLKGGDRCSDLVNIFNRNEGHPANMASFLFSLKDNSVTKQFASNKIDFNMILQNDNMFKIVFVLFYTAIIYHVAQIVKTKGLDLPRHIAFSGNGSKVISILTSDAKVLSAYTRVIFEQVLGHGYGSALDILGLEKGANPKEATCKGGLLPLSTQGDLSKITLKDSCGAFIQDDDTYSSIDEDCRSKMIESVEAFFKFALEKVPAVFNLIQEV